MLLAVSLFHTLVSLVVSSIRDLTLILRYIHSAENPHIYRSPVKNNNTIDNLLKHKRKVLKSSRRKATFQSLHKGIKDELVGYGGAASFGRLNVSLILRASIGGSRSIPRGSRTRNSSLTSPLEGSRCKPVLSRPVCPTAPPRKPAERVDTSITSK